MMDDRKLLIEGPGEGFGDQLTSVRLSSDRLPPYSYVPGKSPHPNSDPSGHSFSEGGTDFTLPKRVAMNEDAWPLSADYFLGCDLFNCGFYWESHEAWEEVWHSVGRKGRGAEFLKGLIKLAASVVSLRAGRVIGARRHALRSAELFRGVIAQLHEQSHTYYGGLDVAQLAEDAASVAEELEKEHSRTWKQNVRLTIQLQPKLCP